jgi:hydroxymethylpyrimidine pyrophosphatase-like HAD family hydrolase
MRRLAMAGCVSHVEAPSVRLLLADVDGTLVTPEKALTERTVAAVRKLGAEGVLFAITSGRPPRGMAMLIEPLELELPLAASCGDCLHRTWTARLAPWRSPPRSSTATTS